MTWLAAAVRSLRVRVCSPARGISRVFWLARASLLTGRSRGNICATGCGAGGRFARGGDLRQRARGRERRQLARERLRPRASRGGAREEVARLTRGGHGLLAEQVLPELLALRGAQPARLSRGQQRERGVRAVVHGELLNTQHARDLAVALAAAQQQR